MHNDWPQSAFQKEIKLEAKEIISDESTNKCNVRQYRIPWISTTMMAAASTSTRSSIQFNNKMLLFVFALHHISQATRAFQTRQTRKHKKWFCFFWNCLRYQFHPNEINDLTKRINNWSEISFGSHKCLPASPEWFLRARNNVPDIQQSTAHSNHCSGSSFHLKMKKLYIFGAK